MRERRRRKTITVLANERRPTLQAYPLVTIGVGALPLPTKQPPRLSAVTTNASANATFFIESPFVLRPFVARQRRVVFSVAEAAARPPVHTKKNQIGIRLCIQRDGAKDRTVEGAAVATEVRVIVFHKR